MTRVVRRQPARRRERGQLPERRPSPDRGSVHVFDADDFRAVRVTTLGKPAPQGSKVAVRGRVVEDNVRTSGWRAMVEQVCKTYLPAGWEPLDGPLEVWLTFYFDPPKTAKKGDWPTTRSTYDVDKLMRALGDALTAGGVIQDDSRIVVAHITKLYVWPDDDGEPRAEAVVSPLT